MRAQIELGLVHKVPARVLAMRFDVSKDAVQRHSHSHLSPVQRAAILANRKPSEIDLDKLQISESEGLLSNLVAQRARLQGHAELAAELGDVRGAVAAENAIISNLALVGKLLGQLVTRHEVRNTSLLISPDYLNLRRALVEALRPFPEASRAVGAVLHRSEAAAAAEVAGAVRNPATPREMVDVTPTVRPLPPPPC